eukprot:1161727-Pelagomonas_calceolata.AAC.10
MGSIGGLTGLGWAKTSGGPSARDGTTEVVALYWCGSIVFVRAHKYTGRCDQVKPQKCVNAGGN